MKPLKRIHSIVIKYHLHFHILFLALSINFGYAQNEVKISNKQKLKLDEWVEIKELNYDTKLGTEIILESVTQHSLLAHKGSLIRLDYRQDKNQMEDFLDMLYPENIILKNSVIVPINYKLYHQPERQHYRNAQLMVSDTMKIELSLNYEGKAIVSNNSGAVLKRDLNSNSKIKLIQGEAWLCDVVIKNDRDTTKEISKTRVKTVFSGIRAPITKMMVLIGDSPYSIPNLSKKIQFPVSGLIVPELPDSIGKNMETRLEQDYTNRINVIRGSLLRIDYDERKNEMYYDVFYPEKIILEANTIVPLKFKIYKDDNQPFFSHSNFIVEGEIGDVAFTFPPDYKGLAIVSGDKRTILERTDGGKRLKVIEGNAYYLIIE